jgi:hypothetical protein
VFQIAPSDEWQLIGQVDDGRRERLLMTPYDEVLALLCAQATLTSDYTEETRDRSGQRRAVFTFKLPPETVDLFHNGAGGYRGQYYHSPTCGEAANAAAVAALLPAAESVMYAGTPQANLYRKSMQAADTKVWIKEGRWLRQKPTAQIRVVRWRESYRTVASRREKQRCLYGRRLPGDIDYLEVKGQWLNVDLSPAPPKKPSDLRSADIHRLGFT